MIVYSSIYEEPLANVLIDAKSNQVPSVIFKVGGLPEIINNNIDGIICENKSSQDLYNSIESCFLNKENTEKMGVNAKLSLKKLKIKDFSSNWLNVFLNSKK